MRPVCLLVRTKKSTPICRSVLSVIPFRIKNTRPRMFAGSWAGVFGCSGRGRGLPILESTEVRAFRAAPPLGAANEYLSFVRAKRVLDFGYVRANGELTRHMSAAGWYTVLSAAAPCVRGCRLVFSRLRCARRSAMAVSPACPAFCSALRHCPRVPVGGAGVIFDAPALRSSYQVFLRANTRGVQPLRSSAPEPGVYPCPCRSSRVMILL